MKVIEKGRDQKGWATECDCSGLGSGGGGCGAKLLVEEDDVYEVGEGGDGPDYARAFTCCECGVETVLDVPAELWQRTMSKRKPQKSKK